MKADAAAPLLTIAIPTFNRAGYLKQLLEVLRPQMARLPQVELLISDNASQDETPQVCAAAAQRFAVDGVSLIVHRQETNIGSDANFLFCFRRARGKFFWMCGDDDIPVPGSLEQVVALLESVPELDMIYATSYGFRDDFLAERQSDPWRRTLHTVRDPCDFAMIVNIMFTFISGIIVNKERLEQLPHEQPEAFIGTNLVQLSWSLPLLLHYRTAIALWTRPIAARLGNDHGYSLGNVFGEKLADNIARLLPGREDLQAAILNFALRRWFPSKLLEARGAGNNTLAIEQVHRELKRVFGRNPRYWLFTWPALVLPLPFARLYTKGTAALSKLIYMLHLPGFWRKQT